MVMTSLIVKNGCVVTMNQNRHIYANGAVAIKDRDIVGVGPSNEILATFEAEEIIDANGQIITPGLIDGHNHPQDYLVGGLVDDIHVKTLLYDYLYPLEAVITPEESYISATATFIEMIRSGITCFNDPGGYDPDSIAQAALDIGMRGIISRSTRDMGDDLPPALREDTETAIREGERTVNKWHNAGDGRIKAWYSLRTCQTCSDELVTSIRDLAAKGEVGIHSHLAIMEWSNNLSLKLFGKRAIERYYDLGVVTPNLYAVHLGALTDEEIRWFKENDAKGSHCVIAAISGAFGTIQSRRIPDMLEHGIAISLGTDTAFQSGNHDFFRQMYFLAVGHREAHGDETLIGAHKAFEMATIDGARACLWDHEIGSLEPGKRADLVLIKPTGPEWHYPARDVIRSLVYSANDGCVDTVVIDGNIILRNREFCTVDEEQIKRDIVRAGQAWMKRADIAMPDRTEWPII